MAARAARLDLPALRRSAGRLSRARALEYAGLAVFVGSVYVAVVLGGGLLIDRTDSPHLGLSVLATAIVAIGFEPVQRRLGRWADAVTGGKPSSPYDVLSRFSETVTGGEATDELPARMSRILAEGTGADWAQVWLLVQDRMTLAATWPLGAAGDEEPPRPGPDARDGTGPRRRALPVRHGGHLLGVLRLEEPERRPLTPVEERLFAGLAAQAGLVLRGVRLRAELAHQLEELSARADELRASRQRLIETQDDERRRLERDIHDGAQQHLVALTVNLRLAQTLAARSPERAAQVLAHQGQAARETIDTLTRLSRGIYPRALAEEGTVAALRAAATTSPVPVTILAEGVPRYPAEVETAVYFCCLEAVQNATKHAGARQITVTLRGAPDHLALEVADDGRGFDPVTAASGAGLANMRDRVDSVGGTLHVESAHGGGTRVVARVPAVRLPSPRSGADVEQPRSGDDPEQSRSGADPEQPRSGDNPEPPGDAGTEPRS